MKYKLLILLTLGFLFITKTAIAQTQGDIQLGGQIVLLWESLDTIDAPPSLNIGLVAPTLPSVARMPSIRDKVADTFPDEPKMLPVVGCESDFRQFDSRGKPLMSGTSDVGVMQINKIHWKEAKRLGLDIFYSVDDNIAMGRIIYDTKKKNGDIVGLTAWTCNKKV